MPIKRQSKNASFSPFAMARARRTAEKPPRQLKDLRGIGPAMLEDFRRLGVRSVEQLAKADPAKLYNRLSKLRGERMDPCVLDTFRCAVEQARDPGLPEEKCQWWYWSRVRKSGGG
jgi:Pathogenicity locus